MLLCVAMDPASPTGSSRSVNLISISNNSSCVPTCLLSCMHIWCVMEYCLYVLQFGLDNACIHTSLSTHHARHAASLLLYSGTVACMRQTTCTAGHKLVITAHHCIRKVLYSAPRHCTVFTSFAALPAYHMACQLHCLLFSYVVIVLACFQCL